LEKKPFALIGVNADKDRAVLLTALKQEKITWRSFLDGGPGGPIANAWGIKGFPSTYVLDHKGVIRYTNLRGEKMEHAARELLKEQEAAPGKPLVAKKSPDKTEPVEPRREDERAAALKLKTAKELAADDKKVRAKQVLEELLKKYPKCKAAEEAKQLLE